MKSPSPTPVRARRSSTTLGVRKTVVSPSLFLGLVALVAGSFATYRGVKLAQRASFWDDSTERRELKSELEGSVSAASLLQSVQLNAQFRTILLDPRKQIEARIEAEKSSLSQKRSLNKDDQSSRGSETSSGSNAPGLDTAGVDQRNEKRSGKKGTEKKSRRDWKVNEKSKRDLETEAETEETSGLRVRVIENGLKGSLHEEAGFVRWRDSVILLGSFNVSRDQAPIIVATQSSSSAIGSTRVTNFNLTTGAVTTGPDLPVLMHHPAAAISPGGVIHVVGSADWSDMSSSNDDAFQFTWDVEGGGTEWVARARYLGAAGGFSCEFLGELMYCCGGGRRLQERTGNLVRVYSPANDSWSEAAPLPERADHIALILHDGELWAVGGASTLDPKYGPPNPRFAHDHYRHSITQLAIYNPRANQWSVRQPLPNPRAAPIVTVIQRPGKRPSMLVGGGEVYLGSNGMALGSLLEYDFEEDVWYCHVDPLPFPVFGAGSALWNNSWYILGGGESYNLAATDRVMIVDVANLPTPEPCGAVQQEKQESGWWRTRAASWQQNFPYSKHFLEKR